MITVELKFQDDNIPSIKENCNDKESALTIASHLCMQFAGIKAVFIRYENFTEVYNASGNYLFGIPKI